MSTKITISPSAKPAMTTLRDLTKQQLIGENVNADPSDPNLAAVKANYTRACELWPAAMRIAAAIVANDNSFTGATLDALLESNAP